MRCDLSQEQWALIAEALDSHQYWQLSERDERNDGYVCLPGECDGDTVHDCKESRCPRDDRERHAEIAAVRALSAKVEAILGAMADEAAPPPA